MNVLTKEYHGQRLRYLERPQGGLLFNTKDVCRIAGIQVRDGALAAPCIDLAVAVMAAILRNIDFGVWLADKFAAYGDTTPVDVRCDDDWSVFRARTAA